MKGENKLEENEEVIDNTEIEETENQEVENNTEMIPKAEYDELEDRYKRVHAEFENYKKKK